MEELLNDTCPTADLEKFEKEYIQSKDPTDETTFQYAFCLVRSPYTNDIRKGINMLEELTITDPDNKRDYIYYLALGNTRMKQYEAAMKYCKAFLNIEPTNEQVCSLQTYIKKKQTDDLVNGAVAVGGVALIGGLAALAGVGLYALSKNKKKPQNE